MENNEYSSSSNWNQGNSFNQPYSMTDVPNAKGAMILGIISICVSILCCWCYGYVLGLILSVIGFFLGAGAVRKYNENPEAYTEKSFRKAKTWRTINLIMIILNLIVTAVIIVFIYLGLTEQLPPEMQDAFEDSMRKYDFD